MNDAKVVRFIYGRNGRPYLLGVENGFLVVSADYSTWNGSEEICRFLPGFASTKLQVAAEQLFESHRTKSRELATKILSTADFERLLALLERHLAFLRAEVHPGYIREQIADWLTRPELQTEFQFAAVSMQQKRELLAYLEKCVRSQWSQSGVVTRSRTKKRQVKHQLRLAQLPLALPHPTHTGDK